ncbi:cytochrome P450 [Azospirillum doebereinerae]
MSATASPLPLPRSDRSALPFARGLPLVGNLPMILKDPLGFFLRLSRTAGPVVRVNLGLAMGELLLVSDPAVIAHILEGNAANYQKGRFYGRLRGVFGENIILADGDDWWRRRRLAAPAFSARHLEAASWVMTSAVTGLVDTLERSARRREPVDLFAAVMELTLGVIVKSLFGVDVGVRADAITAAVEPVLREGDRRVWWPVRPPRWVPTATNRQLTAALADLDRVVYGLIDERRRSGERREDILDALLAARDERGEGLSDRQLRDEVVGLIVSGYETTATTLAWALEALSRHPAVEAALRGELERELGPRLPLAADLRSLTYTRAVLLETMRLNPAVWTISRQAVVDDVAAGVPIGAATVVMMPPHVVHRSAAHWANPEGFDPGRFLDGEPKDARKFTYLPFGGGPRRCLGAHFSMMEMQIVLATLLQRFRFSLIPGSLPERAVTLTVRPRDGLWMTVEAVATGRA